MVMPLQLLIYFLARVNKQSSSLKITIHFLLKNISHASLWTEEWTKGRQTFLSGVACFIPSSPSLFTLHPHCPTSKQHNKYAILGSPARPKGTHHQGNSLNIACRSWRICFGVLLVGIPHSPSLPGHMGNHSTSLSSPIITILLSSELESDTFSKTFQITPLLGFSTKPFRANLCFVLVSLNRLDVTWACKKCLLLSCQSVLVVSAGSVAGAGWIRG